MSPQKIKWFISGVLSGAVILYIILLTSPQLKTPKIGSQQELEQNQNPSEGSINSQESKVKKLPLKKTGPSTESPAGPSGPSLRAADPSGEAQQGQASQTDSIPTPMADTVENDTSILAIEDPEINENTELKKDILLESKVISIQQIIQNTENNKIDNYKIRVEFWQSPVHYKGYKLGEKTLILFGLQPSEIRIEKQKNVMWLYHKNTVYLLQSHADFKPYNTVKK